MAPPTDHTPVLSLQEVTKKFGDFTALDAVSLDLYPGQIHALLGANGSGKSTLVKIMSGVYRPDGGSIQFDGARLAGFGSPAGASARGIRVVHQEAPLIDTLSVTEAVAIFRGFGAAALGPIGWRRLRSQVQRLLDVMDVPIDASQQCSTVQPADRAGLALAIVVGDMFDQDTGPPPVRLLIVDEVTAAIQESDTQRHLDRLRIVADRGVAVVMVTHRLAELRIADDVTVLRAGQVVYRENGSQRRSNGELVSEMVGPTTAELLPQGTVPFGQAPARSSRLEQMWDTSAQRRGSRPSSSEPGTAIGVEGLGGLEVVDVSFSARPGEIVGFAGLRGSGVGELPRLLSGDQTWTSGTVAVGGQVLTTGGQPRELIEAGLAAIPADRLRAGGVASLTVRENVALPALGRYWHQNALLNRAVHSVISAFDVRPPRSDRLFGGLSGGNQQKVLLGKWLLMQPRVLVLDDPTYGVDPAARENIFEAVEDSARRGVCVLFFSTEPEQLVRICNRILVLRDGVLATELSGQNLNLETVMEWSYA